MTCNQPHAVVTGASSGIGRATALRLAEAGWHVFAGVRRSADGDTLRQAAAEVTPVLMDITDSDQIAGVVGDVAEHVGSSGLNALVDNAGIGVASPMEMVALESLRRQLEINVVGQVAVTQAFVPLLRQARGRIVFIGSIGDRFTPPFGGPLTASKAAIASIAEAFRQELAPWDIKVVLVKPASINSGAVDKLERDAAAVVDDMSDHGRALYRDGYLAMVSVAAKQERDGSPPRVVADTVLTALTTRRPRASYLTGKHAHLLANVARWLPAPALDALRRKVFHLPAPGSRAMAAVRTGAVR